ncbi:MAG: hypothetical protein GC164_10425 [Phycisphaera sp.]|nr:hypothetical protein [Phycisphaera sp.]
MNHGFRLIAGMWGVLCGLLIANATFAAPDKSKPIEVPDLTQGAEVDTKATYNLGATGMRGWIFTKPPTHMDSYQGRTTVLARQILVTHIGQGTPADGVMRIGDVIVGVDGKPFADDARKLFATAIQRAESTEGKGDLDTLVWRDNKTQDIHLPMRVLGDYGDEPLTSQKAKLIFDEACNALEKEGLSNNWAGPVSALAMLASGKESFLPTLREYAHIQAQETLDRAKGDPETGTWELSYRSLFLCEYYLLTHDQAVYPAIEQLTMAMVHGQSMFGTYGHRLLSPGPNGELYGSVPAYGPVNETGLVVNIAIVLGAKCGVDNVEVRDAIDRASRFFGTYVNKGAIPYGEHLAYPTSDNNGKNAMAAVFFTLQGNRPVEAHYFARMCAASFKNREYGHTGQGLSYLWTTLGANTAGPIALSAYFKQASWHYDLVRRTDGSFTYDGAEQYGPGSTDDNTYFGRSGYNGLSPNATYVLAYSVPLRKIFITGRDANEKLWLDRKETDEAIASGNFDIDRKQCTVEQLITALGNWSPITRGWAAEELATRPEAESLVPRLMEMARGDGVNERLAACEALGAIKDPRALPVLAGLLKSDDYWLRYKAAEALSAMGKDAKPVLNEMLDAIIEMANRGEVIDWRDPIQFAQTQVARSIFTGMLRSSFTDVDPKVQVEAVRAMMSNTDGAGRASVAGVMQNMLTEDQVRELGPDILKAIHKIAPADTMFGDAIREAGVNALTKYHFEEGLEVALLYARTQSGHGSQDRMVKIMKAIASYGTAAKALLPELHKLVEECREEKNFPQWAKDKKTQAVLDGIKAIEATTEQPKLIRLTQSDNTKTNL